MTRMYLNGSNELLCVETYPCFCNAGPLNHGSHPCMEPLAHQSPSLLTLASLSPTCHTSLVGCIRHNSPSPPRWPGKDEQGAAAHGCFHPHPKTLIRRNEVRLDEPETNHIRARLLSIESTCSCYILDSQNLYCGRSACRVSLIMFHLVPSGKTLRNKTSW